MAQYIIGGVDKLTTSTSTAPFWNTYGEVFLPVTEYPPLREFALKAELAGERMLSLVEMLIAEVTKVRTEICRQHGIPIETPYEPRRRDTNWF